MVSRKTVVLFVFILLVTMLGGCAENTLPSPVAPNDPTKMDQQQANALDNPQNPGSFAGQTMSVTVYSATKDARYLVPETHVVPKNARPAQTAIELLLAGTKNADLVSIMPAGTKLRHISVKDNIAYVDFNDKLVKNNTGGSAGEILLVAAIVNTMTEFPDVHKVQILVDGKKIDTISGHMDTSEPLSRSEKIIKK
jgi:spore germination protein GerM